MENTYCFSILVCVCSVASVWLGWAVAYCGPCAFGMSCRYVLLLLLACNTFVFNQLCAIPFFCLLASLHGLHSGTVSYVSKAKAWHATSDSTVAQINIYHDHHFTVSLINLEPEHQMPCLQRASQTRFLWTVPISLKASVFELWNIVWT